MEKDSPVTEDLVAQKRSLLSAAVEDTEQISSTLEAGEASDPELEELLDSMCIRDNTTRYLFLHH